MKGTYLQNYTGSGGTIIYVYALTGSKEDLSMYRKIQAGHSRITSELLTDCEGTEIAIGTPLYFTLTKKSDVIELTAEGNLTVSHKPWIKDTKYA